MKNKSKTWIWISLIVVALIIGGVVGGLVGANIYRITMVKNDTTMQCTVAGCNTMFQTQPTSSSILQCLNTELKAKVNTFVGVDMYRYWNSCSSTDKGSIEEYINDRFYGLQFSECINWQIKQ